jgi:hypothetical protein
LRAFHASLTEQPSVVVRKIFISPSLPYPA